MLRRCPRLARSKCGRRRGRSTPCRRVCAASIENRTRMLAAISHDLRTPLTLLRLRAENVEDAPEREKMLATIAEMDSMIAATLEFARDEATAEPRRRTDLTALLASVVDDMADTGLPVAMEPAQPIVCECQPAALKRALTNLLDNAVKYGKQARAAIRSTPQSDRDHDRRRRARNSGRRACPRVSAVLPGGGITESRDRRDRPRVGHRALCHPGAWRRTHAFQPARRRSSCQRRATRLVILRNLGAWGLMRIDVLIPLKAGGWMKGM